MCKDWPNAGFAVRGHRSPAQGRSLPCRYVRSPEVTLGSAATFDHRTYRSSSALVPECTDSPPAADELFPPSGLLTTWILRCRGVPLEQTERRRRRLRKGLHFRSRPHTSVHVRRNQCSRSPESVFNFARNRCSTSPEIGVQLPPKNPADRGRVEAPHENARRRVQSSSPASRATCRIRPGSDR